MWKYTVESDRPQMTIWRMRVTCLIPKSTNTRTECGNVMPNKYIAWLAVYEKKEAKKSLVN